MKHVVTTPLTTAMRQHLEAPMLKTNPFLAKLYRAEAICQGRADRDLNESSKLLAVMELMQSALLDYAAKDPTDARRLACVALRRVISEHTHEPFFNEIYP